MGIDFGSRLVGTLSTSFVYDPENRLVNASGQNNADRLGSIVQEVKRDGTVTAINSYDAYGIPGASSGINNQGRFRYTGQTWIAELGMYYYKARMYSPTLGRFMQTDPIGYSDGMNIYAYVGNDPVNWVDPSGLDGIKPGKDGKCTGGRKKASDGLCYKETIVVIGGSSSGIGSGGISIGGGGYYGGGGGIEVIGVIVVIAEPEESPFPCTGSPCENSDPSTWDAPEPCPVGINERDYSIPPGYTSSGQRGNRFVRDSNGAMQMNSNYAAARANSQGIDWRGVATDLIKISAGALFPMRNGAIVSALPAGGLVVSGGVKGVWGLPSGDCFWGSSK